MTTVETSTSLAVELQEAQNNLAEATRRLNISKRELEEAAAGAESAARSSDSPFFTFQNRQNLAAARNRLESARGKLSADETALVEAQAKVGLVRGKIAAHPEFKRAIEKQREFVAQAVELGAKSWRTPLHEISSIARQISKVADAEETQVASANMKLRELGLPLLGPRIRNFMPNIIPSFVVGVNLERLAAEAAEYGRRLADF